MFHSPQRRQLLIKMDEALIKPEDVEVLHPTLIRGTAAAARTTNPNLLVQPPTPSSNHSALQSSPPVSLQLSNVGFTINGDKEILRDINLHIPAGKVTALLGPSGAGKTTLLALLSGHASDWVRRGRKIGKKKGCPSGCLEVLAEKSVQQTIGSL
jgi:ABC-type multidrug transport system fused ATPase/permease subunit